MTSGTGGRGRRLFLLARQSRRVLLASAIVFALIAGGVAFATIPDQHGVIHGCYTKSSGALRVIDTGNHATCASTETGLNWNQTGPKGPAGLKGPTGPTGPTGPGGVPVSPGISSGVSTTSGTSVALNQVQILAPVMTTPAVTTGGQYYVSASIMLIVGQGDTVACITDVSGVGAVGAFTTVGPVANQTYETLPVAQDANVPAGSTVSMDCTGYTGNSATSFYDGGITATLIGSDNAPASARRSASKPPSLPRAIGQALR